MKRAVFICLAILALLLAGPAFRSAPAEETAHVVILATSDLHGNVWGVEL